MEHTRQGIILPSGQSGGRKRHLLSGDGKRRDEARSNSLPLPAELERLLRGRETDASGSRWIGPASVERRISERAELLWKKLAGTATMPDLQQLPELLRPPFLGQSMLVETQATAEAKTTAKIAYVGEALGAVTGLRPDAPAAPDATARSFGARMVRLALKSARTGMVCRYESDLSEIEATIRDPEKQILTRAVALPFAAAGQHTACYSIVVVASWRQLLSAEETRALHRELAAAIDWMHRQGH